MKRVLWWILGLMGLMIVTVVWQWPDDRVHLIMCDAGQGDAIIIKQRFAEVLIDGGRNDGKALNCLGQELPFWDRKLEMVIMTHPDSDHAGGLPDITKRYRVGLLGGPDLSGVETFFDRSLQMVSLKQGMQLRLGKMIFKVIWPEEQMKANPKETNLYSVVLQLETGGATAIFTGDLPVKGEEVLLSQGWIKPAKVIKVGHHGSKTSSSEPFLRALNPIFALISVGENNQYHHPENEVLMRLQNLGIKVLRTDKQGTIELVAANDGWIMVR